MRLWGKVGAAQARGKVSWGRGENFVLVHFFWMPGARSNFTHASVSLSAEHGGGRERFCEVGFGYELISKKIEVFLVLLQLWISGRARETRRQCAAAS